MARTVEFLGTRVDLGSGETVLQGLLRAGLEVAHSCRAGVCQSCLVRATSGTPPAAAQVGLKPTLKARGYFLPCVAVPEDDLVIAPPTDDGLDVAATITSVAPLSADVMRVTLAAAGPFEYRPGQFVNLIRRDGLVRSYSLASLPGREPLELHVRVLPHGRMSGWLASDGAVGTEVRLRGPQGECFYVPGDPEQPLLLAGTGTGLAPLYGIVRDALANGHRGPIRLFHGARAPAGLYLCDELAALTRAHANVAYEPVLTALDDTVFDRVPALDGMRVYLCGDPTLVTRMRKLAFLAGADLAAIHADAFVMAAA